MRIYLPLRVRVAIAFAVTTAVALAGLGAFVYYRVQATLTQQAHAGLETQLGALAQLPVERRSEAIASMTGDSFGQVLTLNAALRGTSSQVKGRLVSSSQLPQAAGRDVALEQRVNLVGEGEPEAALLLLRREDDQVLVVGSSQEAVEDALGGILTQLLIGGPLALVLASVTGYWVAGSALRPIEKMRQQAATISAASSTDRLSLPASPDELHRLGRTLNEMLDRLDSSLKRERRFVAEASHELRTPLALLRIELDLALARPRSSEELLAAMRSANDEVNRLTRLSEDLLLLAASDEGALELDRAQFDVGQLLEALAGRFSMTARAGGRRVTITGEYPLLICADRARLDQALSNLLDNALRHGAGDVELDAQELNEKTVIRVVDHGPGMDAGFRERAFDAFTRQPRARSAEGQGLGLAIVRAIVEEHHGTVAFEVEKNRHSTVVTIDAPGPRVARPYNSD
ncbi:ATP-binding protein [soil metagenome]